MAEIIFFMRFSLAALTALSLLPHSYAPQTFYRLDTFAPYPLQEAAEAARKPKDNGGKRISPI